MEITIFIEENKIHTKKLFKTVDCNSFLDDKSDHQKNWLNNIPYGQFRRIRRNCTRDEDYRTKSKILSQRFREKNYPHQIISVAYNKAKTLSQKTCIAPKKTSTTIK